jgi:hypothetical protein
VALHDGVVKKYRANHSIEETVGWLKEIRVHLVWKTESSRTTATANSPKHSETTNSQKPISTAIFRKRFVWFGEITGGWRVEEFWLVALSYWN